MEVKSDLNTFAKILTEKGYDGYFHTEGAYAGKLKESISKYLENCRNGLEGTPKPELLLTSYLQWSGEDAPYVVCNMYVSHKNGKFSLEKMEISREDSYGQLLKKSELANLSVMTVPKAKEAIAMVNDAPKQKAVCPNRRFRH